MSEYNIKQYFDKGLLECRFADAEIELFIAPENIIYISIKASGSENFPTVDIELPDTCNSDNSEFVENGINCFVRKFSGDEVDRESAVILCCRQIDECTENGFKTARYCISVVTNFDDEKYPEKGIDMAINCDYEGDKKKQRRNGRISSQLQKLRLKIKKSKAFIIQAFITLRDAWVTKNSRPDFSVIL